jgi:hypothetical protein
MSGSNWLAELIFTCAIRSCERRFWLSRTATSFAFRSLNDWSLTPILYHSTHYTISWRGHWPRRDFEAAIRLLQAEEDRGFSNINDFFLLTYLYCVNGNVEKAEALATAKAGSFEKDWFVEWLWGELQAGFGFRPPR